MNNINNKGTLVKKTTAEIINKELVMREATNYIKVETTYCTNCKHNHYENIGSIICKKCGKNK